MAFYMITSIIQSEETKLSDLTANLRLFDEQDIKYCSQPNSSVQYELFLGCSTACVCLLICRQITNQKALKFSNLNRVLCIY